MIKNIIEFIQSSDIDDIVNIYKFGFPKRRANIFELRKKSFPIDNMVFFLSTGRCGTAWFTKLLQNNKESRILHNPKPNLHIQGKLVYEILKKNNFEIDNDTESLIEEMFYAGREEMLRYVYKAQKSFIETNNHITFFAPVLAKIFPQAKFIHLYRHPAEFVRSALRRGYFATNDNMIEKRIKPINDPSWNSLSQFKKNIWLWNETNNFIEKFKKEVTADRIIDFNFNELNEENIQTLLSFLEISVKPKIIKRSINKKVNIQKFGSLKHHSSWTEEKKSILYNSSKFLMNKYNYTI
ncbi:MAG: sulfotransferase [Candidatus Cloacimonadota bacterium]|nr:sulfotransferase [Candidatus Cloacimonadota bacterium]